MDTDQRTFGALPFGNRNRRAIAKLHYLGEVCDAPRIALRSTSIAAQLHAAVGDEGLAILPPFMAREYPNLHMVLPNEVRILRSFWMCATPSVETSLE